MDALRSSQQLNGIQCQLVPLKVQILYRKRVFAEACWWEHGDAVGVDHALVSGTCVVWPSFDIVDRPDSYSHATVRHLIIISAHVISAHEWVKEGGNASSIPLDIAVLSNMREFIKYSRLKQMALKVGCGDPSPFRTHSFDCLAEWLCCSSGHIQLVNFC